MYIHQNKTKFEKSKQFVKGTFKLMGLHIYVLSSHTYSVAVHIGSNGLTFDLNVPVSLYKIVLKTDFLNILFFS